ncbi:helix-turn-helix domain-containing protein [Bacillus benzoevorans]|uniref:Transcriptional regulator with XRE-family HTH domain n=1 Tax=Bacillus benzoevorans TaxID=1456 RepID=A0A7X0HTF4_9BACI|nr:helix-turn-helix transcriptional regulator [Bacillus benzoevorans]MBB6446513.1 transcriptional regulator with XRE-family HTH domain [Bacillus benzoevorans]
MQLHEKIRSCRKSKGLSQTYMAKKLKMSISGYNMKELGKRPINTDELQEIAKILGVSASIFFDEKFHVEWNETIIA